MTRLEKCILAKERGFKYDPTTGNVFGIKKIKPLNSKTTQGYVIIRVQQTPRVELLAHHFAWFMTYGNVDFDMLDHIDQNKRNNKISNLRISDFTLNNRNVANVSKGYCWDKNKNKWLTTIGMNYKQKYIGVFDTEEDARNAYLEAKKLYHNGI